MISISDRLKKIREEKNVTQMQVAKDLGLNNKTLSGYERGVSEPDLNTINLLANYYGVTADYLLGRNKTANEYIDEIVDVDFIPEEESYPNYKSIQKQEFDHDMTIIRAYLSLSPESKREIEKMVELYKMKEIQERKMFGKIK